MTSSRWQSMRTHSLSNHSLSSLYSVIIHPTSYAHLWILIPFTDRIPDEMHSAAATVYPVSSTYMSSRSSHGHHATAATSSIPTWYVSPSTTEFGATVLHQYQALHDAPLSDVSLGRKVGMMIEDDG